MVLELGNVKAHNGEQRSIPCDVLIISERQCRGDGGKYVQLIKGMDKVWTSTSLYCWNSPNVNGKRNIQGLILLHVCLSYDGCGMERAPKMLFLSLTATNGASRSLPTSLDLAVYARAARDEG